MTTRLSMSLAALAAASLLAPPLMAQQAPSRPSTPQATSGRAETGRGADEVVSRRGCVVKSTGAVAPDVPTWELRPTTADPSGTMRLVTLPDSKVDLAAHEGRHVEVRGKERREGLASAVDQKPRVQAGQMQDVGQAAVLPPPERADASRDDRGPQRLFEVHAVKTLGDTCSAK